MKNSAKNCGGREGRRAPMPGIVKELNSSTSKSSRKMKPHIHTLHGSDQRKIFITRALILYLCTSLERWIMGQSRSGGISVVYFRLSYIEIISSLSHNKKIRKGYHTPSRALHDSSDMVTTCTSHPGTFNVALVLALF